MVVYLRGGEAGGQQRAAPAPPAADAQAVARRRGVAPGPIAVSDMQVRELVREGVSAQMRGYGADEACPCSPSHANLPAPNPNMCDCCAPLFCYHGQDHDLPPPPPSHAGASAATQPRWPRPALSSATPASSPMSWTTAAAQSAVSALPWTTSASSTRMPRVCPPHTAPRQVRLALVAA